MVNAVDVLNCWWMCEKLVGEKNPRITKDETSTFVKMMDTLGYEWPWTGLESHCLLSNETVTVDLSRSKSFSRKWKNLKRAADVFPVLSVQGTWIFNSHDLTQLVQFFEDWVILSMMTYKHEHFDIKQNISRLLSSSFMSSLFSRVFMILAILWTLFLTNLLLFPKTHATENERHIRYNRTTLTDLAKKLGGLV